MKSIRHTTFGFALAAALAGCSAAPLATAPAVDAQAQPDGAAAAPVQDAPSQYTVYATDLRIASVTAAVNASRAVYANDSRTSTAWTSGSFTKPTFRAVLAASSSLASMRLVMTPAIPFTVETSADARSWKVALTNQKTSSYYPETKKLPAGTAGKYIRLTFNNAGKNVALYEVDFTASGSTTTTPTPAPAATPTPAPAATPAPATGTDPYVTQVWQLVNAERAKVGAKALALSPEISKVAQFRSQDMVNRNYFAHTDPDGHDPFYWLKQYGISYRSAGENIAMGQKDPTSVMTAWMNSSGHKANILNTSFGKIGIGIAKNSKGQIYWTQMFTD